MKHPHHDLIVEWAKDTTQVVQVSDPRFADKCWIDASDPTWQEDLEYRFKPVPKPDKVSYLAQWDKNGDFFEYDKPRCVQLGQIKITRDGETGALKRAEVIK